MIDLKGWRRSKLQRAVRNASVSFPRLLLRPMQFPIGLPPRPRKWARNKEVTMFQMIDQSSAEPEDRKMLLYKIGMFIVALAAVGGVIFLCLRSLS